MRLMRHITCIAKHCQHRMRSAGGAAPASTLFPWQHNTFMGTISIVPSWIICWTSASRSGLASVRRRFTCLLIVVLFVITVCYYFATLYYEYWLLLFMICFYCMLLFCYYIILPYIILCLWLSEYWFRI